jgi:hypothetical protein
MRGNVPVGADDGEARRLLGEPLTQVALKVLDHLRSLVGRRALATADARVGDLDEAGAELGQVVALGAAMRVPCGSRYAGCGRETTRYRCWWLVLEDVGGSLGGQGTVKPLVQLGQVRAAGNPGTLGIGRLEAAHVKNLQAGRPGTSRVRQDKKGSIVIENISGNASPVRERACPADEEGLGQR